MDFVFGLPELKAVLLAVAIISVWAALRYGRGRGPRTPVDAPPHERPRADSRARERPRAG